MTVLAACSSIVAVALWRPPGRWWVRHRLGPTVPWDPQKVAVALTGVVVVGGLPYLARLSGPHVVLALTVAGVGGFALRQVRATRGRQSVRRRQVEVTESVGLLAAELRAGVLPARALTGLAEDFPFLRTAARSADLGGDVPAALLLAARPPGRELLRFVAGAWHVAERSGAPLAAVLDRLERTARDEREVQREVESGVAPARATGRLMAVLPAFGLALGSGMGGDPVAVLTGTWVGVACLAAGSALACAGTAWVERIATSLERDL